MNEEIICECVECGEFMNETDLITQYEEGTVSEEDNYYITQLIFYSLFPSLLKLYLI